MVAGAGCRRPDKSLAEQLERHSDESVLTCSRGGPACTVSGGESVDTALLAILEKAAKKGDTDLPRSIAGKGDEAARRLEALTADGYFEQKGAGKSSKYRLTDKGRKALQAAEEEQE